MLKYEIKNDFSDQRQTYLGFLLVTSFLIGIVLFAADGNWATGQWFFAPWVVMLAGIGITDVLRKRRVGLATWVYLLSLMLAAGLVLWRNGPSTNVYFLMVVPAALATLLMDRDQMLQISMITLGEIFIVTALTTNPVVAVGYAGGALVFVILLTVATYINTGNVLEMVNWAVDIQRKDSARAETFFEQKEQLSEALRQLTHANSRLEMLNVELAEAERKTAQASQAKSTFLSNMSHELRTPLNVIIGYSSTMLDMPGMYDNVRLPNVYLNDIQLIKDSGYYLLGLINDILDLSKIEAGKLELHCSAVDLPEIFNGILATSVGLIKDKPLQIRPEFSSDLHKVWADPMRVRQIVLNLMSNAIKFTDTGSVTLQAEVKDQSIRISVIDSGIGIPEKALAHIFDRFEQAEHDTDKHYGGTGLGLDISKRLAQMHGGDLTVESKVGQGSIFSFTLPMTTASQDDQQDGAKQINTSVTTLAPMDTSVVRTILLVEDEASLREMMRRALESVDYLVVDIQDGLQVMETAIGLLPDLILLDIRLPNVDGWELLKNLKENPETRIIPVVVCTVSDDEPRALSMGAELYLHKPFYADELLANVQGLLSSSIQTS